MDEFVFIISHNVHFIKAIMLNKLTKIFVNLNLSTSHFFKTLSNHIETFLINSPNAGTYAATITNTIPSITSNNPTHKNTINVLFNLAGTILIIFSTK